MPQLSVVIPAFNEEARIGPTLTSVTEWLDGKREDYELLVVDDGSRDATPEIINAAGAVNPRVRLIQLPRNRGKGAAVREGVLASKGDEVLFSDADLATPIEELDKLRASLREGFDVAIGSRAVPGADIRTRQHPMREAMGRTFNVIVRALVLGGIRDTQCGFKLFRGDAGRALFREARVDGFAFDVEVLLLARGRYRVAEVPVIWRHVAESKVSPGVDAARMFLDVIRLKLNRRKPS
jgi:glycosyltransferase involved in cell wall biosynthesis